MNDVNDVQSNVENLNIGVGGTIENMIPTTQNKLVPILQLDSSLDVDKNNDKENENNENSLDDSKEEEIVFPAESKRSFNLAKLN